MIRRSLIGLARLKPGPVVTADRKFVAPPRSELHTSMELSILPLQAVDGRFSCASRRSLCLDRIATRRVGMLFGRRWRPETTARPLSQQLRRNLQCLPYLSQGYLVADLIAAHWFD